MVSKASELLPEPLSPVITVKVFRGISTLMFLRLCWRAPCTEIRSNMKGVLFLLSFRRLSEKSRQAKRPTPRELQTIDSPCGVGVFACA